MEAKGKIYDVAVDLRKNSSTFGKCVSANHSEENKYQLYVPRYFAHVVLSDVAEVVYKVDNVYAPEYEGGLIWNDVAISCRMITKRSELPTLRTLVQGVKSICITI